MIEGGTARQRAYMQLLEHGLVLIRNAAAGGKNAYCRIEADHIHNIPSLMYESNELRHRFFILEERSYYIDCLRKLGDAEAIETATWYFEPWEILATIAGIELSKFP